MLSRSKTQSKALSSRSLKEDHITSETVALVEVTGKVIVTTFCKLPQETNVLRKKSPFANRNERDSSPEI